MHSSSHTQVHANPLMHPSEGWWFWLPLIASPLQRVGRLPLNTQSTAPAPISQPPKASRLQKPVAFVLSQGWAIVEPSQR